MVFAVIVHCAYLTVCLTTVINSFSHNYKLLGPIGALIIIRPLLHKFQIFSANHKMF